MPVNACPAEPNLKVLSQAADLLAGLDDEVFSRACPLAPGGSIGKHLRHCLDFYDCFLGGLPTGMVDYTHRDRDGRVETERLAALRRLEEISAQLEALETGTHRPILVREEAAPGGSRAGMERVDGAARAAISPQPHRASFRPGRNFPAGLRPDAG